MHRQTMKLQGKGEQHMEERSRDVEAIREEAWIGEQWLKVNLK